MDLVIGDEPSCRDAAVELGKAYVGRTSYSSQWPAGCFTISSVFFNPKLDHSSTSIGINSASSGICTPGNKTGLVVFNVFVLNYSATVHYQFSDDAWGLLRLGSATV